MKYIRSHLEDYIEEMYKTAGIHAPQQLDIETISVQLNLSVMFMPKPSMCAGRTIIIDNRHSRMQQWQDFCHELCHVLWHVGNQLSMPPPFRRYQEWKADSFALHACIPTFMLRAMDLPRDIQIASWLVQETFNVTYEFARQRLQKWYDQIEGCLFNRSLPIGGV